MPSVVNSSLGITASHCPRVSTKPGEGYQLYPQLGSLENVANTSGQYGWVKYSVLTDS
jgi:hypothetical protein